MCSDSKCSSTHSSRSDYMYFVLFYLGEALVKFVVVILLVLLANLLRNSVSKTFSVERRRGASSFSTWGEPLAGPQYIYFGTFCRRREIGLFSLCQRCMFGATEPVLFCLVLGRRLIVDRGWKECVLSDTTHPIPPCVVARPTG